jgi:hypothetical protein
MGRLITLTRCKILKLKDIVIFLKDFLSFIYDNSLDFRGKRSTSRNSEFGPEVKVWC